MDHPGGSRKRGRQPGSGPFWQLDGHPSQAKLLELVSDRLILEEDLDEQVLNTLANAPPDVQLEVVRVFRESDPRKKRNKAAYLASLLRSHKQAAESCTGGAICREAAEVLAAVRMQHGMAPNAFDSTALSELAALAPAWQVAAMRRLAEKDLSKVQNPSAFFVAAMRKQTQPQPQQGSPHGHAGNIRGAHRDACREAHPGRSVGGAWPGTNCGAQWHASAAGKPAHSAQGYLGSGYGDAYALPTAPPPSNEPSRLGSFASTTSSYSVEDGGAPNLSPLSPQQPAQRKHHGKTQMQWGVRVDEFHELSDFAPYVHPAAAMELQTLWDSGNRLLACLDDSSWEALSRLNADSSVAVLKQTQEALRHAPSLNVARVNAAFIAAAAPAAQPTPAPAMHSMQQSGHSGSPSQQGHWGGPQGTPRAGPTAGANGGVPVASRDGSERQLPEHTTPSATALHPHGAGRQHSLSGPHSDGPTGRQLQPGCFAGGGPAWAGGAPSLGILQPQLVVAVQTAMAGASNGLHLGLLDNGILQALSPMPLTVAETAISAMACADLSAAKNSGAFLFGIIKRRRDHGGRRGGR